MSRIGRLPIKVPTGVTVDLSNGTIKVKGPKGELSYVLPAGVTAEHADSMLSLICTDVSKSNFYGLARAMVANLVQGVSEGFTKELEIVGVGYRAVAQGNKLVMQMGYSHPVEVEAPAGITFEVVKNKVTVSGINKQVVGAVAAKIRSVRVPEPYKGKGIRYSDEHVRRKAGKSAVKGGTKA